MADGPPKSLDHQGGIHPHIKPPASHNEASAVNTISKEPPSTGGADGGDAVSSAMARTHELKLLRLQVLTHPAVALLARQQCQMSLQVLALSETSRNASTGLIGGDLAGDPLRTARSGSEASYRCSVLQEPSWISKLCKSVSAALIPNASYPFLKPYEPLPYR